MKKYTQILFMLCISYSVYTISADNNHSETCARCREIRYELKRLESLEKLIAIDSQIKPLADDIKDLQQKKHELETSMHNSITSKTPQGIAP